MAGGYLSARPLRELRTKGLFASLTLRGLGLPHSSILTHLKGTARRAPTLLTPHSYGLTPHSSLRAGWWLIEQIPDLLQGTWVFHGGQVAGVAAFADGLDGAAQELAAAGFGQHLDKAHPRWSGYGT